MKYLILLITLVTLANLAYGHDHGGEIARECLNDNLIEADYIGPNNGIVSCYIEGMEMMGPRTAVTRNGSCTLTQMIGKRVMAKYTFIDREADDENVRRGGSAFDEAYDCIREALR